MHVLIVGRGVPEERYPRNGIFEFDQAKALARSGVQITYFAIDLRSIRRKRTLGLCSGTRDGVRWYSLNIPLGALPSPILSFVSSRALIKLYHKVFVAQSPDVIHAHFTGPARSAVALCEAEHIPLVITEHSSRMNQTEIEKHVLRDSQFAYPKAASVIAVGKSLAHRIEQRIGVHCLVIPNVMGETVFFQTVKKAHSDEFRFVFTGNLIDSKRPVLLLEAFRQVVEQHPNARLGIIGDGVLQDKLKRMIAEFHLQDYVKMYGLLQREQIAERYSQCDCFVLPSASETFGVAYIEALAAGLPVIATACGGPEDFVTPELGIMIPIDDQVALVKAMNQMIEASKQFDGEKLKTYVQDHFSEQVISEKLRRVYSDILKK